MCYVYGLKFCRNNYKEGMHGLLIIKDILKKTIMRGEKKIKKKVFIYSAFVNVLGEVRRSHKELFNI